MVTKNRLTRKTVALPHFHEGEVKSRFTMSMSVGHGFAGGENGYAVSGGVEREAKGCVDAKLAEVPVVSSGR